MNKYDFVNCTEGSYIKLNSDIDLANHSVAYFKQKNLKELDLLKKGTVFKITKIIDYKKDKGLSKKNMIEYIIVELTDKYNGIISKSIMRKYFVLDDTANILYKGK